MITAVVVTFNRKELLIRTLNALLNQTKPLDKIFVINNASTDGTHEHLEKNGLLNHPLIHYHKNEINNGGAGGFHDGMKLAYDHNATWIWTMDDDVEPTANALEIMSSYFHLSKCIHPSKTFENGKRFIWEGYFDCTTGRSIWVDDAFIKNKEYTFVNYACFEGMLVHRDIISKIGLPDKRFFIVYDDLIFGWLASFHTNILYLNKVLLVRTLPEAVKTNPKALSNYYVIRNMFILREILAKNAPRFSKKTFNLFLIAKSIKVFLDAPSWFQFKLITRGLRDGRRGKFFKLEF
jgi:rhamnopyranosyl-N-acetylglucosaminyl-diphospho-decaprenol beta-1,3/1,4-galactofuranosyltransferase